MAKRLECVGLSFAIVQNVRNVDDICDTLYLLQLGWIQTSMDPTVPWRIHIVMQSSTWMVIASQVKMVWHTE